ncbi:XRE family transcriptional regulator [bacterium c-19]|nr:XRE family transcriptional regulator [bacterium c-19]
MILRFCTYNIGMAKKTEVHTKLTFAEILEDAIKNSRHNNAEVASLLGVSRGTVSNWVSGARKPDIDMTIQICLLLDLDFYYLIGMTIPAGELRPHEQELLLTYRQLNKAGKEGLINVSRLIAAGNSKKTVDAYVSKNDRMMAEKGGAKNS